MKPRPGNAVLEFTLVGIPMVFLLVSIFSMGLGMWNYHTMENAVSATARTLAVRGSESVAKGRSAMTVGEVAQLLAFNGMGLAPAMWNVTLVADANGTPVTHPCNPLSSCLNDGTVWPPSGSNGQGTVVRITGRYPIGLPGMFWAGAAGGPGANSHILGATAQEAIQF
jgi:hypothetical protein